jgi:outer membrane protein assembly factor BamB
MKQDEPFFNITTKLYQGGNIFTQFIQPRYEQPKFYFIGDKDGIIYCLNAMNGKLYKYNYADNTLTEWIKIVDGCGVDEYLASDNLWFSMNPIMVDNEIIYFDGSKIKRFSVDTQENIIIAEATNFKGWKE